jgi:protein-serine/threonine kinase
MDSLAVFSPESSPFSSPAARFSGAPQPLPVYGAAGSTDTGDEIRFYVEITQVKNLAGLYYVDIKRMRGAPFSFKYVYDRILSEVDLGVWLAS